MRINDEQCEASEADSMGLLSLSIISAKQEKQCSLGQRRSLKAKHAGIMGVSNFAWIKWGKLHSLHNVTFSKQHVQQAIDPMLKANQVSYFLPCPRVVKVDMSELRSKTHCKMTSALTT